MKIVSVNVGLPRQVEWKGKTVTTGIFKAPISGSVWMGRLNLEGDAQADLVVHGGAEKAVYAYPVEHYDYWHGELPEMDLPWGIFGENLTLLGLLEDEVNIGDRFQIGSAEVMVTQPRVPCYKLGVRFGREDMVKRFLSAGRTGFYFAVLKEGEVGTGDIIEPLGRDRNGVKVADVARLYGGGEVDWELLRRAIGVEALPGVWRDYLKHLLETGGR